MSTRRNAVKPLSAKVKGIIKDKNKIFETDSKKKSISKNVMNTNGIECSKIPLYLGYVYVLLPFLIFSLGWMKWYFAIPIAFILLGCFWKTCKESPSLWMPDMNFDNVMKILFILAVIALWVYYSGIGKFVFQNTDHQYRNGIFNLLVQSDWPVISSKILPGNTSKSALIYYIGFWMPSAVIGKLFGLGAGYCMQALWAFLGIVLVYYLICARNKKLEVWPLAVLILFSGLDVIGEYLLGANIFTMDTCRHLEWWNPAYQYTGMTAQLFWVFNQSIPAWLCTMLVLMQKNGRNVVLILACSMLSSTFPFVGLLALVAFLVFSRAYGKMRKDTRDMREDYKTEQNDALARKNPKITVAGIAIKNLFVQKAGTIIQVILKDVCTVQNVIGGGIVGIFSFLYLSANLSGGDIMNQPPLFGKKYTLMLYVTFLLVEIAAYVVLLYKYNRRNPLFYFSIAMLVIIPPIHVGSGYDFCMRASIPFLFVLMLLTMDALRKSHETKERRLYYALIVTLAIGSLTPIHELTRTIAESARRGNEGQVVYEIDRTAEEVLSANNFSGPVADNFFFKYIAK